MTNSIVQSITDEQLEELEAALLDADDDYPLKDLWMALVNRLRAAEADAKAAHQRVKELDLLFGRYLLGMKASVIEMDHGRGAAAAMQWIINGLEGPGELPPEDELDAQAFFDREIKPINDAMAELFEARRAAMELKP